jgi:hypothetical protein
MFTGADAVRVAWLRAGAYVLAAGAVAVVWGGARRAAAQDSQAVAAGPA